MTILQYMSHDEQMEAARTEFEKVWMEGISPGLFEMASKGRKRITQRSLGMAYHSAWLAFVAGRMARPASGARRAR